MLKDKLVAAPEEYIEKIFGIKSKTGGGNTP